MSSEHRPVERQFVHEGAGFGRIFERIIRGEHHVLASERLDRAVDRLEREHAGGRHHDILADVIGGLSLQFHAVELGAAVEAPELIGQGLAEMAERELRAREAVEQSAEHERSACVPVSTVHSQVARFSPR